MQTRKQARTAIYCSSFRINPFSDFNPGSPGSGFPLPTGGSSVFIVNGGRNFSCFATRLAFCAYIPKG